MSFFKDFKDDLSQAVNELITDGEIEQEVKEESFFNENEFSYDESHEIATFKEEISAKEKQEEIATSEKEIEEEVLEDLLEEDILDKETLEELMSEGKTENEKVENVRMGIASDFIGNEVNTEEVTTITKGVHLSGNLSSEGSVDLYGSINGDLSCLGKLVIYGSITGNPSASEIHANSARIEGNITSEGSVNVGNGSVVIGNITATSAVIAGAVKGDIDVQGPVVIDATAVIFGNIKSRSVQLNNGAVLEGVVSQCYSGVDVEALFEEKNDKNKR